MSFVTWLLFFATETALALTPGPAVLFVIGTGLRKGIRAALGANLGILAANTIYFVASALGLGLVLKTAEPLFVAIKWVGAAYLVWLGISALLAKPQAPAEPGTGPVAGRFRDAFRAALLLQLGNPKAILFFTALLPQFVAPDSSWSVALQILVLGVTSIVSEFFVLWAYGALAARAAQATRDPRLLQTFERTSGVCLLGCAALVLAT